jgi:glycerophosphoryl diester phosphodiesterase
MLYPVVRIAHRGASIECPENTLLAFRRAMEHGVDALEIDLHLTRDHQLVVIHDDRLGRTTNGDGWVREHSLAQIRTLDAGRGERVPQLAEVFQLISGTPVRLCIEIKASSDVESLETCEAAVRAIEAASLTGKVIVTSFNPASLLRAKALLPGLATMLDPSPQDGSLTPRQVCEQGLRAGANCLSYNFHHVTRAVAAEARLSGLSLWPWNPNEFHEIDALLRLGVPGIMTDRPEVLNMAIHEFGITGSNAWIL